MEKLNEQQKKLVEENHNLIYKFIRLKNLEEENFYDLFAIALCKAALFYTKDSDYTFSTYAFSCMNNEYKNYLRHRYCEASIPLNKIVSINNFFEDKYGYICEKDYILEDKKAFDETLFELNDFFTILSPMQKKVLKGLLYGYKEVGLARCLKCSRQNIALVRKNICKKYEKYKGV